MEPARDGAELSSGARAPTWDEHLSALQALVDGTSQALHRGDDELGLASATSALARPSAQLNATDAERARALLGDLELLVDELGAARSRVGRELRLHRRLAAARQPQATASYLDSHG